MANRVALQAACLAALACVLLGACHSAPLADRQTSATNQVATNKEIARRFLLSIRAKDAAAMRAVLAPNVRLTLMIAGVYSPELHAFPQGTHWDGDAMIKMEMDFQKDLAGPFALQILSLIGEGDLVAAEVVGSGVRAATGRSYVQHYSYHFQLSQGLIVDIRLYQDTFHLWDIWNNFGSAACPPYHPTDKVVGAAAEEAGSDGDQADPIATNKESVRRFLMAVRTRDPQAERAVWALDGVWSFAVGGDYSPALHAFQGAPRWDREAMISMQQSAQNKLKEPLTLDIYSLVGEGNEVSVEAIGFLVRADGRAYRQHYSMHFKAHAGKLIEGHVYQDTLHQYDLGLEHSRYAPVAAPLSPAQ